MPQKNYHSKACYSSPADNAIREKLALDADEAECDAIIARGCEQIQLTWSDREREARRKWQRTAEVEIKGVCDKWVPWKCRTIT